VVTNHTHAHPAPAAPTPTNGQPATSASVAGQTTPAANPATGVNTRA
jgi:hypothetical protein